MKEILSIQTRSSRTSAYCVLCAIVSAASLLVGRTVRLQPGFGAVKEARTSSAMTYQVLNWRTPL